jgi:hypothetical protein
MVIDGININAEHFSVMKESEAIKSMIENGFVPGATEKEKKDWAKKAYRLLSPFTERQGPETETPEGEEA